MSDDGRKIFAMETALDLVAGNKNPEVGAFLSYVTGREICENCQTLISPVAKGWLCTLNPDFAKASYDEGTAYGVWVHEQKARLGDSISITPMPAKEVSALHAMLDTVKAAKDTAEAEAAAAAEAKAEAEALAPYKAKNADLEKKVGQLEEKNKALSTEVANLKKELAAFSGKIALNANEIEGSVKDMVAKAVKEALANLPVAAPGQATAGAAAPAEEAAADTGGVPDSFGFGTSGADGDGFGF